MTAISRNLFLRRSAAVLFAALSLLLLTDLHAGVPLNNLQGAGGIAFNPLAYLAGRQLSKEGGVVTVPQAGAWHVELPDANIRWDAVGAAFSLFGRLELSFGYSNLDAKDYGDNDINVHTLGLKVKLLEENAFDTAWVPAVSVGATYGHTSAYTADLLGLDHDGTSFYVVATKLITQLPLPVLVSAGVLRSDEVVYGAVGHNDHGTSFFANLDVLPAPNVALGVEFRQGIDAGDGIQNSDYWDFHAAWFATDKLTLVSAYANTGDKDKGNKDLGVGDGFVLSAQYQF